MHIDWKVIRDLIQVDLINMKGGKSNQTPLMILCMLFFLGIGFVVSPLAGLYVPLLFGAFFVPMIFQNEIKYHSEKLWSVLPIKRTDLVNSRFVLSLGLYTGAYLIVYLLMLLALQLKLWMYMSEDMIDLIAMMAENNGFSELGFFNLCYFGVFAFGLFIQSSSLRKYFKDNQAFNITSLLGTRMKKSGKSEIIMAVVILAILGFWAGIITGILPVGTLLTTLLQLFAQLSKAADGFLLGAVFITLGILQTFYHYVTTLLEYSEKEL